MNCAEDHAWIAICGTDLVVRKIEYPYEFARDEYAQDHDQGQCETAELCDWMFARRWDLLKLAMPQFDPAKADQRTDPRIRVTLVPKESALYAEMMTERETLTRPMDMQGAPVKTCGGVHTFSLEG